MLVPDELIHIVITISSSNHSRILDKKALELKIKIFLIRKNSDIFYHMDDRDSMIFGSSMGILKEFWKNICSKIVGLFQFLCYI